PSFSPRLHLPSSFFLFTPPPPPALYTLSLHDALPIYADPSLPIADGHERVEPEAPAALDDFGDAVDRDHVLDETIPFALPLATVDRKSTRLNSSHVAISYAVFCLKKKKNKNKSKL